jgi:hypothetical protein
MPRINKDKYNEYMKEYRRNKKRRLPPDNNTINILDKGLPNLKENSEYFYERTGLPITATLKDGSIIYIKRKITKA